MRIHSFKNIQILRLCRGFLLFTGLFFIVLVLLAFTTLPFYGHHWLGTSCSEISGKPQYIIMLGGSGMPGGSNLMRCWYTARAASDFPDAQVYIVMPGDREDPAGTPSKLRDELILRNVSPERIFFETVGTNTRSQALECKRKIPTPASVLLVTSPEHMRRSVLTFKKAGFAKVYALPSFENPSEADFSYTDSELGERSPLVPEVGRNTQLRYQVWNHLLYEIQIARELTALAYYRLRGWI